MTSPAVRTQGHMTWVHGNNTTLIANRAAPEGTCDTRLIAEDCGVFARWRFLNHGTASLKRDCIAGSHAFEKNGQAC